jgi:hypothetical protein
MQHEHDFAAVTGIVIVDLQIQIAFFDAGKFAGGGFSKCAQYRSPECSELATFEAAGTW